MLRQKQPPVTKGSEHWLRVAVNEASTFTTRKIREAFGRHPREAIKWRSPIQSGQRAEYYDDAFVEQLGINPSRSRS